MTGMKMISAALLTTVLISGCGGGGDDSAAEPAPAASSSSTPPPPSATPRNVESDACRGSMDTAGTIAVEMETGAVSAVDFTKLFDRLRVLQKRVEKDCSIDVQRPLAKGLYQLSRANLWYTLCDIGTPCGTNSKAERFLLQGTTQVREAETLANETTS